MQLNRSRVLPEGDKTQAQNVGQLIHDVLEHYRPQMADKNILLETDFDPVEAFVATTQIHSIVAALIENALQPMTQGGEISVTLIDGKYQWELEVADSFGMAFSGVESTAHNTDEMLPLIIPFPESDQLRNAHLAAISQGAQIETWNCPQGGTAHVLTVPRLHKNQKPNNQFSKI
ncbi:hypothetical protein N9B12_00615 [bacterium]|nr:hypothetical protein [bacterium]